MTDEPDTLARLVAYHDHLAVPPVAVAEDVRRGRRRVRRNRGLLTAGMAGAVAGVVVVASLLDGARLADRPQPVAPQPTIEVSPSPSPITIKKGWTGPLRPGASLSIVPIEVTLERDSYFSTDGEDAAFAGIDISEVTVRFGDPTMNPSWSG